MSTSDGNSNTGQSRSSGRSPEELLGQGADAILQALYQKH